MQTVWIFGSLSAVVVLLAAGAARAETITPLVSYELSESHITVTPGGGDPGLTLSIVTGGTGGAPPATDGTRLLKVQFVGENGKIEFRHDWTSGGYDLAGYDELLADVYIETASAIPGVMGVWSPNWSPPDAWQPATDIPTQTGEWTTISINVAAREQVSLNQIWAFIFENMPGANGTAYVDNLRLRSTAGVESATGIAANGYADRNEIAWKPVTTPNLDGYNIYRAESDAGPFTKLNDDPHPEAVYSDPVQQPSPRLYYRVTSVVDGNESDPSIVVSALYNGLTDDQLMDIVQEAALGYFWDFAHPVSRTAREGQNFGHSLDTVTTGGTGMGMMSIVVGAERGFVTRAAAAQRIIIMLNFLGTVVDRYHGAWAHHYNGASGATIPFAGAADNGGDLVETAFLVQGLLTVRQYFDDPDDPIEIEIRNRATQMWEEVEWDWYRRFPASDVLYWHWSPDFEWQLNHQIRGYDEALIVYLLAVASPTHPMPPSSYHNGWAGLSSYTNANTYFGYRQWVGPAFGGPLFFTHYSNLGFDPRYKHDGDANYFDNSRNISLINRMHCITNPNNFEGYSPYVWGLTASFNPFGYSAHSPTNDNGTITPTAALSAMPYTPQESLAALRHMYDNYFDELWGPYGPRDAFNPSENWFAPGYIAIDQGTIVPMIENYRTGLCWKLFMKNPEIKQALISIGWSFAGDFDNDGDVDGSDYAVFADCMNGPIGGAPPPGCSQADFDEADLNNDNAVDLSDVAIFTTLFEGP